MANPTPQEFYTGSHVRTLFGVMGYFYSKLYGHRGQDFAGWAKGTPIPAYRAGKVVAEGWSGGLGWFVVLQYSDGKFGGFCHLEYASPLNVGMGVVYGQTVGWVGSTGTLSTGPHLHYTLSTYSSNPAYGQVEDGLAHIRAALGSANSAPAGFVAKPIPINPAHRKGRKMDQYFRRASDGKLALFANGVKEFGSQADYDRHRHIQRMCADRDPHLNIVVPPDSNSQANFFNLSDDDWNLEVAVAGGYF